MSRIFGDESTASEVIGEVTQGIGLEQLPVAEVSGAGLRVDVQPLGLFATSVDQEPTGLGQSGAITINYGVGGTTSGGEFSISAGGVITALAPSMGRQFHFLVTLRIGRTGAAMISIPMLRAMHSADGIVGNAVQFGSSFSVEIEDASTTWREAFNLDFAPAIGSVTFIEFARDESGSDFGGLQAPQPTGTLSSWDAVSTSELQISRRAVVS